ncbi:cellular morphogenesis-related protein [Rhodotorula toruloides]|uniref:Cellular morphogenesis-related protein n=1 Tax=Rhodotorula toruloides TaxID=5286 RepID=A0A511KB52_RHOTO|nr:cellular morphogenesis-related protein [Rhodotorula toruloides]
MSQPAGQAPAPAQPASAAASSPTLSLSQEHAIPHRPAGTGLGASALDALGGHAGGDKALLSDPKYRKYSAAVEKTLQSFDQVNEWADFITFLAKLLKTLQASPQYSQIPHKLTVAKRLSQCLNPALPTGVHQRALDVYTHILSTIGPNQLVHDLPAWSSGLFPFFQYAATSVKPIVLSIYERFYLPLAESLRPATKAFILALLPGLEEEAGEWFEKVAALLDRLSGTVSPAFFFQNLWLVLITAANSRIPALNYLARRLPKFPSAKDGENVDADGEEDGLAEIAGQDIGLMVRGFAAALEDDSILVQRGVLDLLTGTLRVDGKGFKSLREADQILLTRSVLSVVLRRDLSLSRRLYAWLLGPSDSSDTQVAHLRLHALSYVKDALKEDMELAVAASSSTLDPAQAMSRQKPFKIFISLLDKWEIGAPLTEVLVLDAFDSAPRRPSSAVAAWTPLTLFLAQLLMTGNMLFEIVDPFILWKQVHLAIRADLSSSSSTEAPAPRDSSSIDLARFIVKTFRLHDEEVQRLHAPVVAFAVLDLVETRANSPSMSPASVSSAIDLANELLHEVSPKFFESTANPSAIAPSVNLGTSLSDALYAADDVKAGAMPAVEGRKLLAAGLEASLRIIEACAKRLAEEGIAESSAPELQNERGSLRKVVFATVDYEWSKTLLAPFELYPAQVANFSLHAGIVRIILDIGSARSIEPQLRCDHRVLIQTLASKLLDYLQPGTSPCYLEAVQLIWSIESLSPMRYVESMISARLVQHNANDRLKAFDAFGNLWRFTEDSQLPGVVLRTPMFAMLDSLKSDDLTTRRAAEAWMRCSLKSYIRILDPLLFVLLDPAIQLESRIDKVADVRVPILVYTQAFDQARVHHVLDNILSLARFGGQGFIRIAKGSFLKHTFDPALRERVLGADLETHTYLDGLVVVLLRLLRADPSPNLATSLAPRNPQIHAVVAELLQVLISRGEAELGGVTAIDAALTSRLFLSIHRGELDLQNKLLHVLHSVVHATATSTVRRHERSASQSTARDGKTEPQSAHPPDLTRDDFFVRVLSDAIAQPSNAVIHHWIDFLLMTIPQSRHSLYGVLFPLIDNLVVRLESLVREFMNSYGSTSALVASSLTDAEYTVLMNALERLLLMAVSEAVPAGSDEERASEKATSDAASSSGGGATGLLGYMTGVLGQAEAESTEVPESGKTRHEALQRVRNVVDLLLLSWDVMSALEVGIEDDRGSSQGHFAVRVRVRARRALERIYKTLPIDVLEDTAEYWAKRASASSTEEDHLFAIVQILAPSPQAVVSTFVEKLNPKHTPPRHKSPVALSEDTAFGFLETYIARMEGLMAVQVWSTTLAFVRDVLANQSTHRSLLFPTLRCYTALAEKVTQTSALEDRRLRRELQDSFIRLADATVQVAGRAAESGGWLRKAPEAGDSDSIVSEKTKDEASSIPEAVKKPAAPSERALVQDIAAYLTKHVLPDMRRFFIDADKTSAVCSNIVYYIAAPAFKTRAKAFDPDPSILALLEEMTKNPLARKAWRSLVSDAFADNRFFNASPSANSRWKPLVQALMASDKERLPELIGKVSTASSANIFTNRELETLSRALSLRRLTYTLLTSPKDRFLTQLPMIQEKLVDLLRSSVGEIVHAEVYLCLRVLFCRIDNQHLSGLWPVILTELLRLFESLADQRVSDGSDSLQLVLSACKFLDLTLVLQTADFQIHEWMFVTDTVDAIYPPNSWIPQAIMDRLGEVIAMQPANGRSSATSASKTSVVDEVSGSVLSRSSATAPLRRPLIQARQVRSIQDLEPFFSTISLAAYEAVYHSAGGCARVDWPAVEASLERDIFDGAA